MTQDSLPPGATLATGRTGSPTLTLETAAGSASIALVGATVLSYTPRGGRDLLWLSRNATCADGKPIRGGVPVCGPWFGPHPTAPKGPPHGLLRCALWTVAAVDTLASGALRATFTVDLPPQKELGWLGHAHVSLIVTVGDALEMELTFRNQGIAPFLLSEALHTYFAVSDVRQVKIEGLSEREYLNFLTGARAQAGVGPLHLTEATTHFYDTATPVRLVDPAWKRAILVEAKGAANSVIWNPWEKAAAGLPDILDEWSGFVCVENANIPDRAVFVAPSTSHHLTTRISSQAIA